MALGSSRVRAPAFLADTLVEPSELLDGWQGCLTSGMMEARVLAAFEPVGLSREEMRGLLEMRRLLEALKRRGDEHAWVRWCWKGDSLIAVELDYKVLM